MCIVKFSPHTFRLVPLQEHSANNITKCVKKITHSLACTLFCIPVKHSGNIAFEEIISIARTMRHKSMAVKLAGTCKEILGKRLVELAVTGGRLCPVCFRNTPEHVKWGRSKTQWYKSASLEISTETAAVFFLLKYKKVCPKLFHISETYQIWEKHAWSIVTRPMY